jgi:hypothetical protein
MALLGFGGTASASSGDGPGTAKVDLGGQQLTVAGVCRDWAFHKEDSPQMSVEAGLDLNGTALQYNNTARFRTEEGGVWFVKGPVEFEGRDNGYVLIGTAENVQDPAKPSSPFRIEVVCE